MRELIEIFIIDDHPIYISGLQDAFYKHKTSRYAISGSATSIAEAREKLKKSFAEVILLDLKLPGESGVDYCAEIKKTYPEKKVIALTGETDTTILFNVMMNGADAIMMKYSEVDEIIEVVADVLKGKKVFGDRVPPIHDRINPEKKKNIPFITPREDQIFSLLKIGLKRREIADKLNVANSTVHSHCKKMFAKFEVHNVQALINKVNQLNSQE